MKTIAAVLALGATIALAAPCSSPLRCCKAKITASLHRCCSTARLIPPAQQIAVPQPVIFAAAVVASPFVREATEPPKLAVMLIDRVFAPLDVPMRN